MESFSTTIPSDALCLRVLRLELDEWLGAHGITDGARSATVLATHEAAANAIEHASPKGDVRVRAMIDGSHLTVDVSDSGTDPWGPPKSDPERGRGLQLIRGLMPEVDVRASSGGTTVHMMCAL